MRHRAREHAVAAVTLLVLLAFVGVPVWRIFSESWRDQAGHWSLERLRAVPQLAGSLWVTTWVVGASVLLAVAVGAPLAVLVAAADFPGRRVLGALLLLPVTLPPLVGALAVRALVQEQGMLPRLATSLLGWKDPPWLDGWGGVLAVHTLTTYPIVYGFCLAALARVDRAQLEAGRMHGAGRLATAVRVLLPALRPALAASATLVAMTCLASFTAPFYFKPDGDFLTVVIYRTREDDPARSVVGTLLVTLLALTVLVLFMLLEGRAPAPVSRGAPRPLLTRLPRWQGWALAGGLAIFILLALLPQAATVLLALAQGWSWRDAVPRDYGLGHFRAILARREMLEPLWASTWMAAAGVLAAVLVGGAAAWWRRRLPVRGRLLVEVLCMLPFALPGTVLALALLRTFNSPWAFSLLPPLAGTVVLLPIAYAVRVLPLLYRGTGAALAGLDPATEEAAATLGASPAERLRRVVLPAILPAVAAAALLAFLNAAGEFPASILLHVPENLPVAVKIDTLFRASTFGPPFAYATLLLVLQLIVLLAAAALTRRRRRGL